MLVFYRNKLDRIISASFSRRSKEAIPEWLEKNTKSPLDIQKPWSFIDHEYQRFLLTIDKPQVTIRKCSQVGVSELASRLCLACSVVFPASTSIYILPSTSYARKFVSTRIDTTVKASKTLSESLSGDVDNLELKQFGSSFIFFVGAAKQQQAISIPARALFRDEVDFCDQSVLSSFESRLGHNVPGEEMKYSFSTPTVDNYGISELFNEGTQHYYFVYHDRCSQWVQIDYIFAVRVPGFDGSLLDFERGDLDIYDINNSYIECPNCNKDFSLQNLADPARRAWVPKYRGRDHASFQVFPSDLPVINPPSKVLKSIKNYRLKKDWINFSIGLPYQDAHSSVLIEAVQKYRIIVSSVSSAAVLGMDVGKVCHITIGVNRRRNMGGGGGGRGRNSELDIIWKERCKDVDAVERVKKLFKQFNILKAVIDAQPDHTVAREIIETSLDGQVWACYYLRKAPDKLSYYKLDKIEQIVSPARTAVIDEVVEGLNCGDIRDCKREEEISDKHFSAMKRINKFDEVGGDKAVWINTGEDHYFHSLVYCWVAKDLAEEGVGTVFSVVPKVSKVRVKAG